MYGTVVVGNSINYQNVLNVARFVPIFFGQEMECVELVPLYSCRFRYDFFYLAFLFGIFIQVYKSNTWSGLPLITC